MHGEVCGIKSTKHKPPIFTGEEFELYADSLQGRVKYGGLQPRASFWLKCNVNLIWQLMNSVVARHLRGPRSEYFIIYL